jgi:ribosome maturation factor RimP
MPETITDDDMDRRVAHETGTDARIAHLIEPLLDTLGFRLVRVRLSSREGLTLQIMLERKDGTVTVEDCEEASRALSPLLDVEDPIGSAYNLEVSSPGIDRPLVTVGDFVRWQGHLAKVETAQMLEGRKRFKGVIGAVEPDGFVLHAEKAAYGESPELRIPFDMLDEARLVLTDELIREALRRDKELRKQAKEQATEFDGEDAGS